MKLALIIAAIGFLAVTEAFTTISLKELEYMGPIVTEQWPGRYEDPYEDCMELMEGETLDEGRIECE